MVDIQLFNKLRTTFCECSHCNKIYRLSDSTLWNDDEKEPSLDVLDKINKEIAELAKKEILLKERLSKVKQDATFEGRKDADQHVKEIDTLFAPLGLNPNDAKVHFHPVDFVVFNGMNNLTEPTIKNIVLLDSKLNDGQIQQSIRLCVENEQYKFMTIKIQNDGTVITE